MIQLYLKQRLGESRTHRAKKRDRWKEGKKMTTKKKMPLQGGPIPGELLYLGGK